MDGGRGWPNFGDDGSGYHIGDFHDWHLPSLRELDLMNRYLWIDRPELSFCDFREDFYWSGEKYEDLLEDDVEDDADMTGDWVEYGDFNGRPGNATPSIEQYEEDLTVLRSQPYDYKSYGRNEYSGASEMWVRLVRKERKSQAIEKGMRIDRKHRYYWKPWKKEVRHTLKYITNPWDTYEGEREHERDARSKRGRK